ncbi:MAG: hypothetical protein AAF235_04975, partial [Planctomycetota bacterium]
MTSLPSTPNARTIPEGGLRDPDAAIEVGRDYLLSLQRDDGHWCARLEGGSITESGLMRQKRFANDLDRPSFRL